MPSKVAQNLFNNLRKSEIIKDEGDRIKVHSVIGAAAFVYEKVRNAIDYNEEHLIRKNAINRILRRKLLLEKVILENYLLDKHHHDNISEQLLQELIRAKYVENDIPVTMIEVIDKIIQKYNLLINTIKENEGNIDKKVFRSLLQMAAVEIEQTLIPPKKEAALARAMFSAFNPRIKLMTRSVDEKEKELQLYINCYRALFKWDESMLEYLMMNLYYPKWKNADTDLIKKIANNFDKVNKEFQKHLHHPWKKQIYRILNKKAIVFWIMNDIYDKNEKDIDDIIANPDELESAIKKACQKRYKEVRVKLRRGVVRSIIYVFFTKMILALLLELPMDLYLSGFINYTTLTINILFPPLIMLVVAMMIRMPRKENTKKIIEIISSIIGTGTVKKDYELERPKHRGSVVGFIFNSIYALTFIFSIFVIFWILENFNFNIFSSLIFVLFLTLVSFFGIRIRRPVNELLAVEKKDNILSAIIDFFSLPFVSMGRFMSEKFSKINFIAFLLDFIIEAPFKLLIEIFEDLFGFLREKKNDVMDN